MVGISEVSQCTEEILRLLGFGRFTLTWCSKVMSSRVKLASEAFEVLVTIQ